MKKTLLFIGLIISLLSCNHSKTKDYMVVIPEQTMQEIFIDLHLSDGIIRNMVIYGKPLYVNSSFYTEILKKYNVTELQFKWNLIHYSQEKKIPGIYEKAISELSSRKAKYEQEILRSSAHN